MRVEDGFQLVRHRVRNDGVAVSESPAPALQTPFTERNAYSSDPVLPNLLKRVLPPECDNECGDQDISLTHFIQRSQRDRTRPRAFRYGSYHQYVDGFPWR